MNQKYLCFVHWFIDTSTYPTHEILTLIFIQSFSQTNWIVCEWMMILLLHIIDTIIYDAQLSICDPSIHTKITKNCDQINEYWATQWYSSCSMILKIMIHEQSFSCIINLLSFDSILLIPLFSTRSFKLSFIILCSYCLLCII
jgi:hypothetical protein